MGHVRNRLERSHSDFNENEINLLQLNSRTKSKLNV